MKRHGLFLLSVFLVLGVAACSPNGPAADWPLHTPENNPEFWAVHGIWFLVFMNLFPRITMLMATVHPIGWLSWLGWLFAPRLLVAILATHYYWDTNPVLCVITWIVALTTTGGTNSSGVSAASRARRS